ncbi:DUF4360 domain-containing protein [Enhygromyxa salina]|nr:DUF4360 domain-containing protein [Enhygromyxa salina]
MNEPQRYNFVRASVWLASLLVVVAACGGDEVDSSIDAIDAIDAGVADVDTERAQGAGGNVEMLPDPNDVWIQSITTHGAGCPKSKPDSAVSDISIDKKSFIVTFADMVLSNPPGPTVKVTNCVASVSLHVPGGWQVSVATINTRGYAFLENGLTARQTSSYFFAGDPVGFVAHAKLVGPIDEFYVFSDEIPFESIVWSACGMSAIFAVNTSLILNATLNPNGAGVFNNTTIDGSFKKEFQFQWRKC